MVVVRDGTVIGGCQCEISSCEVVEGCESWEL